METKKSLRNRRSKGVAATKPETERASTVIRRVVAQDAAVTKEIKELIKTQPGDERSIVDQGVRRAENAIAMRAAIDAGFPAGSGSAGQVLHTDGGSDIAWTNGTALTAEQMRLLSETILAGTVRAGAIDASSLTAATVSGSTVRTGINSASAPQPMPSRRRPRDAGICLGFDVSVDAGRMSMSTLGGHSIAMTTGRRTVTMTIRGEGDPVAILENAIDQYDVQSNNERMARRARATELFRTAQRLQGMRMGNLQLIAIDGVERWVAEFGLDDSFRVGMIAATDFVLSRVEVFEQYDERRGIDRDSAYGALLRNFHRRR